MHVTLNEKEKDGMMKNEKKDHAYVLVYRPALR